jgi:hypothetical protein
VITERFFNQQGFWKVYSDNVFILASIRTNTQITAVTSSTSCKSNNANL